jgi:hypothetical protein
MMVIVGFQSRVRTRGLSWLKGGFRHCFAYQQTENGWVLCDPLGCGLLLRAAPALSAHSLLTSMAALGASMVAVAQQPDRAPMSSMRPATCVEICKRLVGRNAPFVLTPHQLFRHLLKPEHRG